MASMSPNPFTIPLQKSAPASAGGPAVVKSAPRPAPDPARAVRAAAPTVDSAGSYSTTLADKPSPDFTASVRDALRKLRRAQLSRIVKSVVLASAIVCVAAAARAAIHAGRGPDLEVTHTSRVSMRGHEFTSSFLTVHDDWGAVVARPRDVAPKHAIRHASRAHGTR
jgi:hypothetical protein